MLHGHEDAVQGVAFSPDRARIASGSKDGTVRMWDVGTGAELGVLRGHDDQVEGVAFSPDGAFIASGSWDSTVRIWDASTHEELAVLRGHDDWVECVAFSPDGTQIASGARDQTVRIWDARGRAKSLVLKGHREWILGLDFQRPDGARVLTATDNEKGIWDVRTGHCLQVTQARSVAHGMEAMLLGRVRIEMRGTELPWQGSSGRLETVIELRSAGQPLAWHSPSLDHLAAHPSQPKWAGAAGGYLSLLTLEADPRAPLPTKDDLVRLSRRAIVAYAVRCTMRMWQLCEPVDPDYVEAVQNAVAIAGGFAQGYGPIPAAAARAAEEAAGIASRRAAQAVDRGSAMQASAGATIAVYATVKSARCAARASFYAGKASSPKAGADYAAKAAAEATRMTDCAYRADEYADFRIAHAAAVRQDYERLLQQSPEAAPALGDPIELDKLGPLWPVGKPEW